MTTLNDSLTRTETPLASGEATLPVTAPAERVEQSEAVTQVAATSTPALKHSAFGIASFVWSLLLGGSEFLIIGAAAILGAVNPRFTEQPSLLLGVVGLLICAAFPASFLGIALSIVGLFQKDRQKVFPILGLVFNTAIVLSIALLMFIGSQMPSDPSRGTSLALLGALGLRA